jgi:hypothetical protein
LTGFFVDIHPCHAERSEASISELCMAGCMAAIRFFTIAQNDNSSLNKKAPSDFEGAFL